jgi:hypothetical protein
LQVIFITIKIKYQLCLFKQATGQPIPPPPTCIPQEPLIKLQPDGQAPQIRYNLPQSTVFNLYGSFLLDLPATSFRTDINNKTSAQANKTQQLKQVLSPDEFKQHLKKNLQGGNGAGIIYNFSLMRKHPIQFTEDPDAPLFASKQIPNTTDYIHTINTDILAQEANPGGGSGGGGGGGVIFTDGLGGYNPQTHVVSTPTTPNPSLFIVEEYSVASYLGNFGAGKVVRTFSLLPGEKTTITVKTFKETETTRSRSDNAVDSFSQSSANELEKQLEQESQMQTEDNTNTASSTELSASASGKFFKIVDVSANASHAKTKNVSAARSTNTNAMSKALDKHVTTSNASRNITVNTSTTERYKETEEQSIVRVFENPNKSRTLNFVFRQLVQEYVTVTYLSDVRIAYCDGSPQSFRIVDLQELDRLLEEVIKPEDIPAVRYKILSHYCPVLNLVGEPRNFIQRRVVTVGNGSCNLPDTFVLTDENGNVILPQETFYVKSPDLMDEVTSTSGYKVSVKGVILNVQEFILNTDSVVVEALLGQGEALDCFSMRIQQAEADLAQLENAKLTQQMSIISSLPDAQAQADSYQKVFAPCCPASETTTNGGGNASK